MNTEHERVIEAMSDAIHKRPEDPYPEPEYEAKAALRAAAEQGYVLAKIPEKITLGDVDTGSNSVLSEYFAVAGAKAWNDCLDAIETIELEGGDE